MTRQASAGAGARAGGQASAPPDALRVERLVRRAAREGNRMVAGNRVLLRGVDPELELLLRVVLERMGARLVDDAGAEPGTLPPLVIGEAPGDEPGAEAGVAPGERRRGGGAPARIEWALDHMPATRALAAALRRSGALVGHRVLLSLVLEPKTAALALALREAGAEVAVFAAASECDAEVAVELAARGAAVFAPFRATAGGAEVGEAAGLDREHALGALDWRPTLLIDDGAHLIRLAHTERPGVLASEGGSLIAASEETTSGVRPLLEMASEGALRIPVIAVNDARTKTGFDNLVGTGQSCVLAIGDLLDSPELETTAIATAYSGLCGRRCTVIGYGPVGQGVARFAAAFGARVTIVERDSVRALAALHDGFEARSLADALGAGGGAGGEDGASNANAAPRLQHGEGGDPAELVVSATGVWHTLDLAALELLAERRPGAVLAVAGGIDDEIALDELREAGWTRRRIATAVEEWRAPSSDPATPGLLVLAEGGGVNYTAAEGNPIEVMDLSFATQLAALERLAAAGGASAAADDAHAPLAPGVHRLTATDEDRVARAALAARAAGADPRPEHRRTGGAAQPWGAHRYRDDALGKP